MFEVYLKSPMVCSEIKTFQDEELFSREINNRLRTQLGRDNSIYEVLKIKSEDVCDDIRKTRPNFLEKPKAKIDLKKFKGNHTLPRIAMMSIELYSDEQYPRGISILYKIDGYRTQQVAYVGDLSGNANAIRKRSILLNYNEYVSELELWKTDDKVLHCVTIHVSTK